MLEKIIREIGLCRVADECGVNHRAVAYWIEQGRLPKRHADAARRARYERIIARLAGMKVDVLRKQLKENGK